MARYLITGGCGFVGSNLADRLLNDGEEVVLFDNLSRKGTEKNLAWLEENHKGRFRFVKGDTRDFDALRKVMDGGYAAVYHTAGQVAVTTSVVNPREDFEINALGTFNVLEAIRTAAIDPVVVFTSTNKVYGGMEDVEVVERGGRYTYKDLPEGADESRPLDFHSPYGCSKGTADQYVRDYARIYGMRTVVFRMSCQYGIRQFGNEDQGWVVHFVIAAHFGKPINIYGDGKQVRDMLYIEDLCRAFRMATERIEDTRGQVFNIGGGPDNVMSLLELVAHMEKVTGRKIRLNFSDWRPGDQPVFITNVAKARARFGWAPTISKTDGVTKLHAWVAANEHLFDHMR
jgi:CDP-paratose 2-epimerase